MDDMSESVEIQPDEIGYVDSQDGTQLYFEIYGEGIPILTCNGLGCSRFYFKYLRNYLSEFAQVIHWDYKGHGKSQQPDTYEKLTIEDLADDSRRVLDAVGRDEAVFLGHSMGCQVIFEASRMFPDRVAGLIPLAGSYEYPIDTFYDSEIPKYIFPVASTLARTVPEIFDSLTETVANLPASEELTSKIALNPLLTPSEIMQEYLDHLAEMDMKLFFEMARGMQDHSASDVLPQISEPTLVIVGTDDDFTPQWKGEEIHQLIPDSELAVVNTGTHVCMIEQPELVNLRIEKFLATHFDIDSTFNSGS